MKRILFISLLFGKLDLAAQSDVVRQRVRQEYRSAACSLQAAAWWRSMRSDGTWADIDYEDHSRSLWQLEQHLDRLVDMSLDYASAAARDTQELRSIIRGIRHWFVMGYQNDNWWYTKIGVPRRMLALAYILDDDLPATLRDTLSAALDAIDSNDHPARPGGDRIQVLSNHAKVLLWRRDSLGAATLFRKIEAEAAVAPMEEVMLDAAGGMAVRNAFRPSGRGLQADMTFHHRGDRVNSTLTYGLALPQWVAYWAQLLADTPWRFSDTHLHTAIDYYLDGVCRHLVRGRYVEPAAYNRELARPKAGVMDSSLAHSLLDVSGGYRAGELRLMAAVQEGRARLDTAYAHHFWQSDYFVFARPHYQSAVRMHSVRNANQEAPHNGEGLRNHFRGDGACHLSVTGTEYRGLQPVFDFSMIPGVTAPHLPSEPLEARGSVQLLTSATLFAGAVSDTRNGAAAIDFRSGRSDLRARKAWFFMDEGYVCLGSDISCTAADTIMTTIEQCRQLTPLHRRGRWFLHGGNAYHVVDGKPLATAGRRHGRWANCVSGVAYAADTLTADVVTLAISHGVRPMGAHYAYAVAPGAERPVRPWYRILQNGRGIQAVESRQGDVVYAVFYEAGAISTSAGLIRVDRPCMVMVRQGACYVSDPTRQASTLTLTVGTTAQKVALPQGADAGRTVKLGKR